MNSSFCSSELFISVISHMLIGQPSELGWLVLGMRRQGQYGDSGPNAYVSSQMQHTSSRRVEHNSDHFQGTLEAFTPERDPYANMQGDGQWRWERDGSKVSNPVAPQMFNEGQGRDASRSYYQGQRPDLKPTSEKQGNNDPRSQPHEDMDIGYEDDTVSHTFEGLEQKFRDDIMKSSKEQTDAEDAENARHREKINAINAQYEEQLAALRARHAGHRDEFLKKESQARHLQYQQVVMDQYPNSGVGPGDSHGYAGSAPPTAGGEVPRSYNNDQYDKYRERARYPEGGRDHGFDPRSSYPGGRAYGAGSRHY